MDESAVRKIVKSNIKRLTKMLGLQDWDIDIAYDNCNNNPAQNWCDIDYKIIEIVINPARLDSKAEVLHTMLHELLHAVIASFQTYRLATNNFLADKEINSMSVVFGRAEEETVMAFVRILEGMEK